MRNQKVRPVVMWATLTNDRPPKIYDVGWYKPNLQSYLKKIRVVVRAVAKKRKR